MTKKLLINSLLSLAAVLLVLTGIGFWLASLVPAAPDHDTLALTKPEDLTYLQQKPDAHRGKILMVVSSTQQMGNTGRKTGYELTELARPYYVFTTNGFEVDIASPEGGEPRAVIDRDDMGPFDYSFLNDSVAQQKTINSLPVDAVDPDDYHAVFFVGGKAAMFDFPGNNAIQELVASIYDAGGFIGAVCHGPAALAGVTLKNGQPLLHRRQVSAFTNEEELFLIPDADSVFPFLLEDALRQDGAVFKAGPAYLEQISVDGRLLTGQNPWSTWQLTEAMIGAMGYQPVPRTITPAENTVALLLTYERQGMHEARNRLQQLDGNRLDRRLLAMHGVVAAMKGELLKTLDIIRLLARAKAASNKIREGS
ncbi:type 1 glutamine amidotransferase domain-containing protein [Microbulbifer celer]|uniref:Type 1 glutamine amidotransferase domain-containing protein n=1 Tax=Microbulbifer celer TaxID=435905 RepID=A0ABW3U9Y4_9GAMM|nr:type 1 glutamine amidotransferase domain-containing protein [Microbulbifer celer]UFN57385.1 type 1 glutamine amidotransferase domain-containing protein [Microbulbifer celer]